MRLKSITVTELKIPFKSSFKHASAERSVTGAVIAIAESCDGIVGYGEGCPREYVTGESIASCKAFIAQYSGSILKLHSVESIISWVAQNDELINRNPAAWCAVETALLDLLGKSSAVSIDKLLGLPDIRDPLSYAAVLGVSQAKAFDAQLAQYVCLRMKDFKIKVSGDRKADSRNIKAVQAAVPVARIRIDANNLWSSADEAYEHISALNAQLWAIEEPLAANQYASSKQVGDRLNCKVILDESFQRTEQFQHVESNPSFWIPNIRISKMGGLIRSLLDAKRCRELGMRIIIGSQVGETSLLTRVALSLANANRDILESQEGAFGTYLLERDVTSAPLMFSKDGVLIPPSFGAGLGLGSLYVEFEPPNI